MNKYAIGDIWSIIKTRSIRTNFSGTRKYCLNSRVSRLTIDSTRLSGTYATTVSNTTIRRWYWIRTCCC